MSPEQASRLTVLYAFVHGEAATEAFRGTRGDESGVLEALPVLQERAAKRGSGLP